MFARPPYLRDELLLAPTLSAPAAARAFVQQLCHYWEPALPDRTLVDRAVLLASELVTNAVVHAHTDLRLRREAARFAKDRRRGDQRWLAHVAPSTWSSWTTSHHEVSGVRYPLPAPQPCGR